MSGVNVQASLTYWMTKPGDFNFNVYLDNAAPAWYFWFAIQSDRGGGAFPGLVARCDDGPWTDHIFWYPTISIQDGHFAMRLPSCFVAGHGRILKIQWRQAAVLHKLRHRHFEHTHRHKLLGSKALCFSFTPMSCLAYCPVLTFARESSAISSLGAHICQDPTDRGACSVHCAL